MAERLREKFEGFLGQETCCVHFDESANKNAWYGYESGFVEGLRMAEEIAERVQGLHEIGTCQMLRGPADSAEDIVNLIRSEREKVEKANS